jgi:hypothetical protein
MTYTKEHIVSGFRFATNPEYRDNPHTWIEVRPWHEEGKVWLLFPATSGHTIDIDTLIYQLNRGRWFVHCTNNALINNYEIY